MKNWTIYLVLGIVLIILWEYFGVNDNNIRLLISSPSYIFEYFQTNYSTLFHATWVTFLEAFIGLIVATLFSFGMMIICFYFPKFMTFIMPLMVTSQVIPLVVLAPFFIILLGIGIESKIAMAALMSFFPIFVNFALGFKSISKNVHEMMSLYNVSKAVKIRTVYFPLSMPSIISGLKISATFAVVAAIVAEFNGTKIGLGKNLFLAAKRLEPELMMSSLILSTLLGFFIFSLINLFDLKYGKWYR